MALENLILKGRRLSNASAFTALLAVSTIEGCCDCSLPTSEGSPQSIEQFIVVLRNEGAPSLKDPERYLTTHLTLNSEFPRAVWVRDEERSYLVSSSDDINAMSMFSQLIPSSTIDNLVPAVFENTRLQYALSSSLGVSSTDTTNMPDQLARILNAKVARDEDLKWGSTVIIAQDVGGEYTADIREMLRGWIFPESDPHAKATIQPIADDAQGNRRYRIAVFRKEADNTVTRQLTADFNFGTGEMQRVNSLSNLNGPYSKIAAGCSDADGFIKKDFGVDNRSVSSSNLYMPAITAQNCWPNRTP